MTVSYSAAAGSVPRSSSSATRRSCGRTTVFPSTTRIDGAVLLRRQRAAPLLGRVRRVGREPSERDLVAVEEAAQLGAGRVPAVPDHDRARRRRLGRDALQPADPLPMPAQPSFTSDLRRDGRDRVVVVSLDPHDARRLGRAKPDRESRRRA